MNPFDLPTHVIWRPGIGDNSWWGWATVAAYYGTALLAGLVATDHRRRAMANSHVYAMVALLLFGLAIARQVGLLRWLTEVGRAVAWQEGWYMNRWLLQRQLVRGGLYGGVLLLLLLIWLNRRTLRHHGATLLGVSFLLSFIAIRAISYHNIDLWLARQWMGIPINTLLEMGALLWIACSLYWASAPLGCLSPRQWLDKQRAHSSALTEEERST